MQNTTIAEDARIRIIATNVVAREHEIFGYQINIDNYTVILTALPAGEWPENTVAYKGISDDGIFDSVPTELQQIVSDYKYRDKVMRLLASEKIEQGKSVRVRDALISQLPVDQIDALVQAAALAQQAAV